MTSGLRRAATPTAQLPYRDRLAPGTLHHPCLSRPEARRAAWVEDIRDTELISNARAYLVGCLVENRSDVAEVGYREHRREHLALFAVLCALCREQTRPEEQLTNWLVCQSTASLVQNDMKELYLTSRHWCSCPMCLDP